MSLLIAVAKLCVSFYSILFYNSDKLIIFVSLFE